MKQRRIEISVVKRIDKNTLEVEYYNGEKELFTIKPINTRVDAIKKAIELTKKALLLPDAFEKLNYYKNNFSRFRNYEIEEYIDELENTIGHRIVEECPFNGFSGY